MPPTPWSVGYLHRYWYLRQLLRCVTPSTLNIPGIYTRTLLAYRELFAVLGATLLGNVGTMAIPNEHAEYGD